VGGAPGEKGAWGLRPEDFGREVDAPALGLFEATRVGDLPGGDEVYVARFYLPLPLSQS
jgi:hypothetical protein